MENFIGLIVVVGFVIAGGIAFVDCNNESIEENATSFLKRMDIKYSNLECNTTGVCVYKDASGKLMQIRCNGVGSTKSTCSLYQTRNISVE